MSIAPNYHQTVIMCKREFTERGLASIPPNGENRRMTDEDKKIRIHNASLLLQLKAAGVLTEFAKITGKQQSYWSDVLRGEKSFGPTAGRMLEDKFNLPKGWMEVDRRHLAPIGGATPDGDADITSSKPWDLPLEPKKVPFERTVGGWHPEDPLPDGYRTIGAVEATHTDLGGGSRFALVDYPDEKPRVYSTEFFSRHKLDPRNLKAYRVSGDSMRPMLRDGCWVVIDTTKTAIVDECIYALAVGDELMVKQLVRGVANKIVVNSFNPSHPTQVVDPEVVPVQIFGQVVEYSCVLI